MTVHFIVYFAGTWNGDPAERLEFDCTNTWMKREGQWQMVKSEVN